MCIRDSLKSRHQTAKANLLQLGEMPSKSNYLVYAHLHKSLPPIKREIVEEYRKNVGDKVFAGKLVHIYNAYHEEWLSSGLKPYREGRSNEVVTMKTFKELLGWDSLFRMFEVGSKVVFFSCGSAGYMFADNYAYDSDRRRVLAWTNGYQRGVDEWSLVKEGNNENIFFIKNNAKNEYMYSTDSLGEDDKQRRVLTWRSKANNVVLNDGRWKIFETSNSSLEHLIPYIEFYYEDAATTYGGSGYMCRFGWQPGKSKNWNWEALEKEGCKRNKARSMKICNVKAGIIVYLLLT